MKINRSSVVHLLGRKILNLELLPYQLGTSTTAKVGTYNKQVPEEREYVSVWMKNIYVFSIPFD